MNRAMPEVYDEIYRYARGYLEAKSQYAPQVKKDTPPSKKFPLVIIKEVRDNLYDENLDKTDQRFRIGYDIEIYTMNKGTIAKQTIANELIKLLNDVFDEHYGMNRRFNREIQNIDTDVYRWKMRFEGKIDEKKRIYRR